MAAHHATGIYEIRNIINGKRYVGSAVNFGNRWRVHAQSLIRGDHHSPALQRAWRMYGPGAFHFNKLLACSKDNLLMYEQIMLDAMKPEYNIAKVAGSQLGLKRNAETKAKNSAAAKRTRNFTGHSHTEETRAKISAAKKGVKMGAYSRERVEKTAAAMRATKSVLSVDSVMKGRRLRADGATIQQVADACGCTFSAAYDFLRQRTYTWVK